MPDTPPCLRCGSDAVVPDAQFIDSMGAPPWFRLVRAGKQTLKEMFSSPATHKALARICSDCGHIEFVAEDPGAVWADHLTRTAKR
jgi:hypothetical protein